MGETGISARLISGLGNIKYNSNLQMLEFTDAAQFKATMTKIETDAKNFQFDKGNTQLLLNALNGCNVNDFNNDDIDEDDKDVSDIPQNVIKLLRRNTPLSDTVLLTFLRKSFKPNKIKRVLLKNCDFTSRVSDYYELMTLPSEIRTILDAKRIDHVPYIPGFDDFEKLFPNYISFKKYINEQERTFLIGGGDPLSPSNPKRAPKTLIGAESVVFNQYKEVKIGNTILKRLATQNVYIKNGSETILNAIRQTGQVPQLTPPTLEPENGFPIAQAPPIVDTNILVQPTDSYNQNCGGEIGTSASQGERVNYSTTAGGSNYKYYWNFGDGYVSYKRNPSHKYVGTAEQFSVTVTPYDSQGNPCGVPPQPGGSTGGTGGGGGTTGGTPPCGTAYVFASALNGFNSNINVNVNIAGYTSGPIHYFIQFGDGSTATGDWYSNGFKLITHGFPLGQYTTYNIAISITYANTVCGLNVGSKITFNQPPQPPNICCDVRDREKQKNISPDNDHKFNHKLVLHNYAFFGFGGKFTADVNTYKRIGKGFVKFWFQDWAYGCVDIQGNYFSTSDKSLGCNAVVINFTELQACGGAPNHGQSKIDGSDPYRITNNGNWPFAAGSDANAGVRSGGYAYGTFSEVFIGKCDD